MAVVRGTWQRVNGTKGGSGSGAKGGLEWRLSNSEADAKTNLRNTIQIRMWFQKNGTMTSYNLSTLTSRYEHKIGSNAKVTTNIGTRYDWREISNNTTIYYITDDYPFRRMSGAASTFSFDVPIDPNTGKSPTVTIGTYFDGDTTYFGYMSTLNISIGGQLPVVEVTKKVNVKVNSVYKKGDLFLKKSSWTKSNLKVFVKNNNTWKAGT